MSKGHKQVRLHKNLAVAVVNCLEAIFNQGKQADKVIAKMLKSDKRWGKRDRFIAETLMKSSVGNAFMPNWLK